MAPVSIVISTTGKVYRTPALAVTEISSIIQSHLEEWIDLINEPDEISIVARESDATDKAAYPIGTMVGFHRTSTGGDWRYGLFLQDIGSAANQHEVLRFSEWTGLGAANNGYGTYVGRTVGGANSLPNAGIWKSGDDVTIRIIYCADPGDQYFFVHDNRASAAPSSANANARGIVRLNRPTGASYPSKTFTSEFVAVGRYFNNSSGGDPTSFQPAGETFATVAAAAGGTNLPWTERQITTNAVIQSGTMDLYHVWAGLPMYSQSLYMGNLPPGVGFAKGVAEFTALQYGTEIWRSFTKLYSPKLMIREAL